MTADVQEAARLCRDVAEQHHRDDAKSISCYGSDGRMTGYSGRLPRQASIILAIAYLDQVKAEWKAIYEASEGSQREIFDLAIKICAANHSGPCGADPWTITHQLPHPTVHTIRRGDPGEWHVPDIASQIGMTAPLWRHYMRDAETTWAATQPTELTRNSIGAVLAAALRLT